MTQAEEVAAIPLVEERTERVSETLRRTEVEVERLESEEAAESGGAGDASRR